MLGKNGDTFLNLFDNGLLGLVKQLLQLISALEPVILFQLVLEWLHELGHIKAYDT